MAISPKLEFRQTQSLVMTPQLQQAIKLLQLSNLELGAYIEEELEKNPILERAEEKPRDDSVDDFALPGSVTEAEDINNNEDRDKEFEDSISGELEERTFKEDVSDISAEGAFASDYNSDQNTELPMGAAEPGLEDGGFALSNWGGGDTSENDLSFEQVLSSELSLKDHLREQLGVEITSISERLIGAELIESIDEAGYLREDVSDMAVRLGCKTSDVDSVLNRMQGFDPVGVFAQDLRECLSLQLKELDRYDPAMQAMVENIQLIANVDIPALVRICGVNEDDIRDMIAELKLLDPKPGLIFDTNVAAPIIPDVFVKGDTNGGWTVTVNSDSLPRLLVDRQYYASVSKHVIKGEDRTYLSECLQSANWLVKSLDQRARTILKVSTELVRQQDSFLTSGVQFLRPLNLRTIADAVDIHESTVSRVTTNKYMATPRGIFELKYFFTSAISSNTGGDDVSSEAVREKIRDLIDNENSSKVLSDDKIVNLLSASGIEIARRTVAKYREAMGIQSSVQRRRTKRLIG